jgi:hypothetical protein
MAAANDRETVGMQKIQKAERRSVFNGSHMTTVAAFDSIDRLRRRNL